MTRNRTVKADIAALLDTEPATLPYLPELLADLDALGSWPDVIVELLRPLGLDEETRVLDLACGKGAVALAVAEVMPVRVTGVDAFAPFVAAAHKAAEVRGLATRCCFEVADFRSCLTPQPPFDVVIFASIGPIFGGITNTVERLAQTVHSGGWIVIDDCFLRPNVTSSQADYEAYLPLGATRQAIESAGVSILSEVLIPQKQVRMTNRRNNSAIRQRGELLMRRCPEASRGIRRYIERQEAECRFLESHTGSAVWLLQRNRRRGKDFG